MAALYKLRLSLLVVFSAGFGYAFAFFPQHLHDYTRFVAFLAGAFLITASAAAFNQLLEVKRDKRMQRTCARPLPSGRLSMREGLYLALLPATIGFALILLFANMLTFYLCFFSFFMYVCVYTYTKKIGPLAVLWGAIPGAMPPLLGYTASANYIAYEGFLMFSIQFIWQFCHFWSLAWVLSEDYKKAGFWLLPGEKNTGTALCMMLYALFLVPLGMLPAYYGITGIVSGGIATLFGCVLFYLSLRLIRHHTNQAATQLKYAAYLYLPTIQVAYLLDKMHG